MKNRIVKQPSFLNFAIGLLMHSLGSNDYNRKIKQLKNIDGYELFKTLKKENNYMDSSIGCYTKNRQKFFIKTFQLNKKDFRNYFIFSEWYTSNVLYNFLKSKKYKIIVPKPVELIVRDKSVSIVYEYIDGNTLSLAPQNYQAKVLVQVLSELEKISLLISEDNAHHFPKRSLLFYFISLPCLSFLAFFKTGKSFNLILNAFWRSLKMLLLQKINGRLFLTHGDLKPHNILIKDSKIYLIDVGRMALTLPGYDMAVLSLDPAYSSLYGTLEKKFKKFTNIFLKSYIAIQFADSNSPVGIKYLKFLNSEYRNNVNFKKFFLSQRGMASKILNSGKFGSFSLSLIIPKSVLASRYFYHLLFSNFYHLGSRVTFGPGVNIQNAKHISLGNRVYLERNVTLKFLEEFIRYGYERPNLKIDDAVTIGDGTIISAAKFIHIKKDVLIAPHCFIGDHDHEYRDIAVPIRDQGYKNVKKIVIKEGAWIAANSTICSGVTIGKNSVIGANSVVTKDVSDFSLAVGNPAKVVKKFDPATKEWEKVRPKNFSEVNKLNNGDLNMATVLRKES